MAKAVKEIEEEIRALNGEEKIELLRSLIAELDAPADHRGDRGMFALAKSILAQALKLSANDRAALVENLI